MCKVVNKYKVIITHQYTQTLEVYAENKEQAFDIASQSDEGINCDDTVFDYEVKEL